jgi:hypothetical protein
MRRRLWRPEESEQVIIKVRNMTDFWQWSGRFTCRNGI